MLQYVFLLTVPVLGLTQASGIAVARAIGLGDERWANQIGNVCIYVGQVLAVLVFAMYLIAPLPFLDIFLGDVTDEVNTLARNILWISAAGQIFETLRNVASGGLRAYRDTMFAMYQGIFWMAVVNIPLTYVFMFVVYGGLYGLYVVRAVTITINGLMIYARWWWLIRGKKLKYGLIPLDAKD